MARLAPFDKYFYYKESVQDPLGDIRFFRRVYKSFFKKLSVFGLKKIIIRNFYGKAGSI